MTIYSDERLVKELVGIGFCQPKFYKKSVWDKANALMKCLEQQNLVYPHDFGRGKGKWSTDYSRDFILDKVLIDKPVDEILVKYRKYLTKNNIELN